MPEVLTTAVVQAISLAVATIVTIVASYVTLRLLRFKNEFTHEMTQIINDSCIGKERFAAHEQRDEERHSQMMREITRSLEHHEDHYKHSGRTDIHQTSLSKETLDEKFDHVKTQIASVGARVENVASLVEALNAKRRGS